MIRDNDEGGVGFPSVAVQLLDLGKIYSFVGFVGDLPPLLPTER